MKWEREGWIEEYQAGETITEIARRHGISRKSVHKWISRYDEFGVEGLKDLSRAPEHHPRAVELVWHERVAAVRRKHPRWGAPKLEQLLKRKYDDKEVPSVSTIGRILQQQGLSSGRNVRKRAHASNTLSEAEKPNEVWCIDFKGWRRTGDGEPCHPLTLTDQCTRYLLCCQALPNIRTELVQPVLERVFRQYGLPLRMRSDKGPPFAAVGECGLTELSAWWIQLGIECERVQCAQQNGRHERMHRTLGEQTMDPPASTLRKQQKRFDEFRTEYNQERPHQALDQQTPDSLYHGSPRPYPERIPEPGYAAHWQVRIVDGGQARWRGQRKFISHALSGKQIGFEPVSDGSWRVWFYKHLIGVWCEKSATLLRPPQLKDNSATSVS